MEYIYDKSLAFFLMCTSVYVVRNVLMELDSVFIFTDEETDDQMDSVISASLTAITRQYLRLYSILFNSKAYCLNHHTARAL